MARRASGISGLVYGISVNVKHAFLRRKGRKKINEKGNVKKSERTEKQQDQCALRSAPECSWSSLQARIHCGTRQTPLLSNWCNCRRER